MVLSTYLPIIVGVVLFIATFVIRSMLRSKDKQEPLSSASTKSGTETKAVVIAKPAQNYGPIHIFFGSQTGAAQNFAKILSEEAMKMGFDPQVVDLVDFHPEFFKDVKLALFTIATHGEGEPTENAKKFSEFLIDAERKGSEFAGLKFSVFALGNKQYQFYCGQGKRVNEFLEKLGGSRVYKYGEGDDNENLEDDFNNWKEGIWTELVKISKDLNLELPASDIPVQTTNKSANALPFNLTVSKDLKELESFDGLTDSKEYDFQAKQYLASSTVDITSIRELRQKTEDGSTLHVELNSGAAGLTYKTAHNLGIYPENNPEIVNKAASVLGFDLADVFEITQNPDVPTKGKFKHPVPSPISVKTYLTKFCDLTSALRKKQLKDLAPFCSNEDNKNKLLFLASNEGKAEYDIQIQSRMKGLLDIIEEYDVKLTLGDLINISSLILPRLYTIASSHRKNPDSIHLCVSLQRDNLPEGKLKHGMTADFLLRKQKEAKEGKGFGKARINIRESTFSLPTDANRPIIMVGPGAGIAPFMGFIDEKEHLTKSGNENTYGEMTLYFGCKGQDWDYLYKEELTKYHTDKVITNLHLAFSRATDKKVYVQDMLIQNREQTMKLLFESDAVFYMCGSMAMGKDVIAKLGELAASYYNIDIKEGQKKIEEMEKAKKIIKELWG